MRLLALSVTIALVAVACGGGASPRPAAEPAVAVEDVGGIPPVRRDLADVELADVVFDTFGRGQLTLAEASDDEVAALLDVIPPLDDPVYDDADGGRWLASTDAVLGYVTAAGGAYAYPHKIMALHEIVNATLDGIPLLVSYCPLCNSGVVFDRRSPDRQYDSILTFSNTSALFDNDLVMVDRETGTYWWQVPGRAIVGTLVGSELTVLPSQTMTWGQWRDLHPDTRVLSRETGFIRDYDVDRFLGYADRIDAGQFPFPVEDRARNDDRLTAGTQVIGVDGTDTAFAVPLGVVDAGVARVVVDGIPIVIMVEGDHGGAFRPTIDGLAIEMVVEDGRFVDASTGTEFDLAGRAVAGPLVGAQLEAVPSRSTFWFAYVAARPDVIVQAPTS